MCAFLSRPLQAKPHPFERRSRWRADISSRTGGVRASRCTSRAFQSSWTLPKQLPSKALRTRFSQLSAPQLSNPGLSNFVARSSGIWGFEFLPAEWLQTLSVADIPLQSTEAWNALSRILGDVKPLEVLSFTFVSTVFGIMAAFILHELKDHKDSPSIGLLDDNRQSDPRIVKSSSTPVKAGASDTPDVWLNFSRSSPFFRSVSARCPSLSSSTAYQYVPKLELKPEFQRQCLATPDGGTLALDWPSHLDIERSKELENVMLLVCGTTEGSHEDGIVKFSQLVEQHGYFPAVFNPRGCGGSPLTTPRVFSAADSDDVRLAVQFIAKSRPWAAIVGVSWGLGANILARYLGEDGSNTPLTAAVCIDTPFDLSWVTRPISSSRWVEFNRSLSEGLVQILASSKMLFQGQKRGFDLDGALAATSVRDFDQAISRVVHGYTTVEDFYVNTSSGATLEGVRIPLLCILHLEDYTRIQASIPQQVFETNAYTMLLVSSPSDSRDDHPGTASDWTHAISLEWLTAVEIAMLKGRHPQVSGFSPTFKFPTEQSKNTNLDVGDSLESRDENGATRIPGTTSGNFYQKEIAPEGAEMERNSSQDPRWLESIDKNVPTIVPETPPGISYRKEVAPEGADMQVESSQDPILLESKDKNAPTEVPGTTSGSFHHREITPEFADMEMNSSQDPSHLQKEDSIGGKSVPSKASARDGPKASETAEGPEKGQEPGDQAPEEELTEEEQAERGQVVQAAETVMNVLDVTMPSTLADAQKQQVLKAVGRGETIVTALEEAVPEDVRGKMSTAVSDVIQAQGLNLKMAGGPPSAMLPKGVTDRIQGTILELTGDKAPPKSDIDVSSRPGDGSSADKGTSGKTAQNDDTTKENSPDRNDTSSKKEKPSLNDEAKDSDKGMVATKGDKNVETSKDEQVPPKDLQKSGEGIKTSGDPSATGSPNVGDQPLHQGDQGKNKQEQARGSVDGDSEGKKDLSPGGSPELSSRSDNPSDKADGGDPGQGRSSASQSKDSAMDTISPAGSEEVSGRDPAEENSKIAKDAENQGEVKAPSSNNDLQTSTSDSSRASGDIPNSQSPKLQVPQNDPTGSGGPDGGSPVPGSQSSPSTDVPADASTSSPPSSQESQSDRPKPEAAIDAPASPPSSSPVSQTNSPASADAPNLQPPNSQPSQTDTQQTTNPPQPENSPPPPPQTENSPPPPPQPESSPPAPTPQQNPPAQSPPVPLPSVGQAMQALTGFDDSTQMAVTNIFGVVENVLDQLEEDNPSDETSSLGEMSAEKVLKDAAADMKKGFEQNANKSDDDNPEDECNGDKQSEEAALVSNSRHEGSQLQPSAEKGEARKTEESNKAKSTERPLEVKESDSVNRFSRTNSDSRGVKPNVSKNRWGYITDGLGQQTDPGMDEEQSDSQNSESTLFESTSNPEHGSVAESAHERRLKAMAAEIDAESEVAAEPSSSGQAATDQRESIVQESDSSRVTELVMNALKLEVVRRLGSAGLEAAGVDLEKEVVKVANAVSEVVTMGRNKLLGAASLELKGIQDLESNLGGKLGVLNGNRIVAALGSALGGNSVLGGLLPFGVLAGVVMAALGATYLIVADDQEEEAVQKKKFASQVRRETNSAHFHGVGPNSPSYREGTDDELGEDLGDSLAGSGQGGPDHVTHSFASEEDEHEGNGYALAGSRDRNGEFMEQTEESKLPHQGKMMGAMAAAMGATAAVASSASSTSQSPSGDSEHSEGSGQNKLVPELAEKAVSIVAPVIPKTDAGDLDHEKLVAVLTEVGQRGGPLTLVGKVALLWGGLRGAMSLTDRLLAFLRIKERPLHERLLGFGVMAVLLWTPVLIPLLPTLLEHWATKTPTGVADAAAGIGLYGAVFILVTIWGRRVRGYERPLVSYGLQLFSRPKLKLFAGGLATGVGMVSGYYAINWLLGYSQFTWEAIVVTNPAFPGALASSILTSWKVLILVIQSLTKAVAVALVEEVLFRSWLQEELAVDLGYHWAVVFSAVAFALAHWSPTAVVGLWFLAVALAGARARTNGDLSLAIGIHAGIITLFAVLNIGGLVSFLPDAPVWITGAYAANPWAGALGTGMVAALAVALYPRQQARHPEEK